MKNAAEPNLQELALFLRNAAYADKQSHHLDWSLHIVHPRDNNGDVSFSGGIWTRDHANKLKHFVSLSLSYSQTSGIHRVEAWKGKCSVFNHPKRMPFADFKSKVISLFEIEELYQPREDK